MRLPFGYRLESRGAYTDVVTAALQNAAAGSPTARVTATGALEACAGLVGRSFATATVETTNALVRAALTPSMLETLGRSLIVRGQFVAVIDTEDGLTLLPASTCEVMGGARPDSWRYKLEVSGPNSSLSYGGLDAAGVIHATYTTDAAKPWVGIGPIQAATLAGKLSANTADMLGDEASGPRGNLLPAPVDGEDPTIAVLKSDIKGARGKTLLVEAGDWQNDPQAKTDWQPRRMGATPPQALIQQHEIASREIAAACGVPPALLFSLQDGTAQRESYRRFLHTTVTPLAKMVAAELTAKLDAEVTFNHQGLAAADVASKARAYGTLVSNGYPDADAREVVGLE